MARKPKSKPTATPDNIAVYAHLFIQRLKAEKDEKLRTAALKKEMQNAGVNAAEIQAAIKEANRTSTERLADAERKAVYLQAVGAPVQLELFESSRPRVNDPAAVARQRGRMDAIIGKTETDTPWAAGTAEGQAWLEGHRELMDLVAAYHRRFETTPDDAPVPEAGDIVVQGYDETITLKPRKGDVIPPDQVDALADALTP